MGRSIGSAVPYVPVRDCGLDDALVRLREAAAELLTDIDFLQSPEAARLLGAGECGVALAATRSLVVARKRLDDASRDHAALLGAFGVSQRVVAGTLDVSTNTVTRWGRERVSAPTS